MDAPDAPAAEPHDQPTAEPLDEMVSGAGRLRPHWRDPYAAVVGLGWETLAERAATLDRGLADAGLGGEGEAAGWRLDPVPLVLPAGEFAALEAGLAQRATLLELMLRDVYGPQRLLATGALPPALVFGNPAFLHPCRVPEGEPAGPLLHAYAADLLRGPDGAWQVLADRTAAAAGASYALEMRRALSRTVPELFGNRQLRRLRPWFETWQDTLQRLIPAAAGEDAAVALLTPGASDPQWFEHVTLSREMALALVEGGDLTVRDGGLFLKTLRGLRPVGTVLRRQDGRTVDPLELDPGSGVAGVPGLLDAVREGRVRVVNDPGVGLAEAPALAAYLPALAPLLLGETLCLPSVPTTWLGAPGPGSSELGAPGWRPGLDGVLVRSALDGTVPPVRPATLSKAARSRLEARMAEAPEEFALLADVAPSVAPCLGEGGLVPRPVLLRLFLVWDGARWRTMPGGLARVLTEDDPLVGRLPRRAVAKDVWVLAEEGVGIEGPASFAAPALAIRRGAGEVPSRVADDFYWLGRYLERLEGAARLLRSAAERLGRASPTPREWAELHALSACLVRAGLLAPEDAEGLGAVGLTSALLRSLRDGERLAIQITSLTRLSDCLRDSLTGEMHAALAGGLRALGDRLRATPAGRGPGSIAGTARAVLGLAATVAGLAAENMVRGGGGLFLELGRRVERAGTVAAELALALAQAGGGLATQLPGPAPGRLEPGLRLTLELRDSVLTYRGRYHSTLQPAPVLDLVLADAGNPRGLAFQLTAIRDTLAALGGTAEAAAATTLLLEAEAMVRAVAAGPDQAAMAAALPARLHAMEEGVGALSQAVARRWFAVLPAARGVGRPETPTERARLRGAA